MSADPVDRWLQIKDDPQIRETLFHRRRIASLFDGRIDAVHSAVAELLCMRGVFHVSIHDTSNQFTCWLYENPYSYRVFVGDEVVSPAFPTRFPLLHSTLQTTVPAEAIEGGLHQFKRMRFQDEHVYLRNVSINRINGLIGLTFSCVGTHYVPFDRFFVLAAEVSATLEPACLKAQRGGANIRGSSTDRGDRAGRVAARIRHLW